MGTTTSTAGAKPKLSFFVSRNFALLWIGQAVSDLGDVIYLVTLSLWIATVIAHNQPWAPAAVSGVLIATALPTLVLGPVAGVFVDRWDKRLTMARMDMIRALLILLLIPLTGLLPLPFLAGSLTVSWKLGAIYAVVLAASICAQFFRPARFTILSEILPEHQRAHASAMEQTSSSIVQIIGPFLAAPLLFVLGVQWALVANALSFVVSFVAILTVRIPASTQTMQPAEMPAQDTSAMDGKLQKSSFIREFQQGLLFYRRSHLLRTLAISVFVVTLGTGAFDSLLVFFFQTNLHAPTSLFGTLPMAVGAGSVLGAILAALLVKGLGSTRVFWLSFYLIGIGVIVFTRQTALGPALVLLCLVGLPLGSVNTALGPLIMHVVPHDIMGRVIAVFSTGQTLCNLISVTLSGLLGTLLVGFHAEALGMRFGPYDTIYLATGVLFVVGGFYAMVNLRGLTLKEAD
jgi:MFS family permease